MRCNERVVLLSQHSTEQNRTEQNENSTKERVWCFENVGRRHGGPSPQCWAGRHRHHHRHRHRRRVSIVGDLSCPAWLINTNPHTWKCVHSPICVGTTPYNVTMLWPRLLFYFFITSSSFCNEFILEIIYLQQTYIKTYTTYSQQV